MRARLVWIPIVLAAAALAFLLLHREEEPAGQTVVDRPGEETVEAPPVLRGNPAPAEPAPEPECRGSASIYGTVLRDGEGARARVEVRRGRYNFGDLASLLWPPYADGEPIATTESAADGSFRLEGLDLGGYELTAYAEDGAAGWERCFCRPAEPDWRVRLELVGGEAVLVGRAVYADGSPFRGYAYARLPDARRRISSSLLPQVPTDEEGRFRLRDLPVGEIDLTLLDPERFASTFGRVSVPQVEERVFVVDDGLTAFDGTVVADDTDEPIEGARISVDARNDDPPRRTVAALRADAAGAFRLLLPVLSGRLWVRAEGFAPLQVGLEPDTPLAFRLKRRGRVTGRVVEQEGGRPVAGARVHGWSWGTFDMKSPLDVSAEDGTFAGEVGPGRGMIYVLDATWVSADLSRLTNWGLNPTYVKAGQGETTDVVLEVVPAGHVEGTVTDPAGDPLPGARVTVLLPLRWEGFMQTLLHADVLSATTDADGHYAIGGLVPAFPYRVEATPLDGLPATSEEVTVASGATRRVDLQEPVGRTIEIQVVEEDGGAGVARARVSVRQGAHWTRGLTEEDGRVLLGPLLPEAAEVYVECDGYVSPTGSGFTFPSRGLAVDPTDPDGGPVVVRLAKGRFLAGRVLASDGSPWARGGLLTVHAAGEGTAQGLGLVGGRTVAPSGFFERVGPLPAGTYDVVLLEGEISSLKFVSRWTVATDAGDLTLRVDAAQAEEAERERVVIEVVDAEGRKVGGLICIYARDGGRWEWFFQDGEYMPPGLAPGTTVWIHVQRASTREGEEAGGAWTGPIEVHAGANRIELQPPRRIAGRVRDAAGKPVVGLLLQVEAVPPEGSPYVSDTFALPATRTDQEGRFELGGLEPGMLRLLFAVPEDFALRSPPVAAAGREDLEIRLEAGAGFDVRVLGPDGSPLEGATVTAALRGVAEAEREVVTDANGTARLAGLAKGEVYDLTVEPPESRTDLTRAWRLGWAPASIDLPLEAGRTIEGTTTKGGVPLPYATVFWRDRRGAWQKDDADDTAWFRVTVLADSEATLRAAGPHAPGVELAGEGVVVGVEQGEAVLLAR